MLIFQKEILMIRESVRQAILCGVFLLFAMKMNLLGYLSPVRIREAYLLEDEIRNCFFTFSTFQAEC